MKQPCWIESDCIVCVGQATGVTAMLGRVRLQPTPLLVTGLGIPGCTACVGAIVLSTRQTCDTDDFDSVLGTRNPSAKRASCAYLTELGQGARNVRPACVERGTGGRRRWWRWWLRFSWCCRCYCCSCSFCCFARLGVAIAVVQRQKPWTPVAAVDSSGSEVFSHPYFNFRFVSTTTHVYTGRGCTVWQAVVPRRSEEVDVEAFRLALCTGGLLNIDVLVCFWVPCAHLKPILQKNDSSCMF